MEKGTIRVLVTEGLAARNALEQLAEHDPDLVIVSADELGAQAGTNRRAQALIALLDREADRGPLIVGAGPGGLSLFERGLLDGPELGYALALMAPQDCYWPSDLSCSQRGQRLPAYRQLEFRGKGYRATK